MTKRSGSRRGGLCTRRTLCVHRCQCRGCNSWRVTVRCVPAALLGVYFSVCVGLSCDKASRNWTGRPVMRPGHPRVSYLMLYFDGRLWYTTATAVGESLVVKLEVCCVC